MVINVVYSTLQEDFIARIIVASILIRNDTNVHANKRSTQSHTTRRRRAIALVPQSLCSTHPHYIPANFLKKRQQKETPCVCIHKV